MNWNNYGDVDGQINIFDYVNNPQKKKITKPIRLIELFAGVGSQAMSLRDLGANFERYKVVEFDKYAIASYNAIHGTDFPVLDITKISGKDLDITETEKYEYIMFYSFPCTDLSNAGLMKGMEEGSGTRSSLLWECKRLLEETDELPQILVMENVPQVHGKKNYESFQKWLDYLHSKGYTSFYQDLNAKNYGVAQSRNRTFCVSLLGNYTYTFPAPFPLEKRMKDYLEDEVDEKYYIKTEKARELIDKLIVEGKILVGGHPYSVDNLASSNMDRIPSAEPEDVANTILARDYKGLSNYSSNSVVECNRIGGVLGNHQAGSVYDKEGLAPTLWQVWIMETRCHT